MNIFGSSLANAAMTISGTRPAVSQVSITISTLAGSPPAALASRSSIARGVVAGEWKRGVPSKRIQIAQNEIELAQIQCENPAKGMTLTDRAIWTSLPAGGYLRGGLKVYNARSA
jgi:hypothetical protein